MRRTSSLSACLGALALACTPASPPTESDADRCSNGRDDDGDGLVDCRDPACGAFTFCASALDGGVADAGVDDAGPLPDAPPADGEAPDAGDACARPLDVVLVVDVSSSMGDEVSALEAALPDVWDAAHALDPSATFSLVAFVDDVQAVGSCAPFATADALVAALAERLAHGATNAALTTSGRNYDCPENSLDALWLASGADPDMRPCAWREGSDRVIVHMTDDTFLERPGVLSGEWGGGVFVGTTYGEIVTALNARGIRVAAFARSGAGEFCGAPASPDVGRGFFTPFPTRATGDEAPLPEVTGGAVWDLRDLSGGGLDVATELTGFLRSIRCAR